MIRVHEVYVDCSRGTGCSGLLNRYFRVRVFLVCPRPPVRCLPTPRRASGIPVIRRTVQVSLTCSTWNGQHATMVQSRYWLIVLGFFFFMMVQQNDTNDGGCFVVFRTFGFFATRNMWAIIVFCMFGVHKKDHPPQQLSCPAATVGASVSIRLNPFPSCRRAPVLCMMRGLCHVRVLPNMYTSNVKQPSSGDFFFYWSMV